MTDASFEAFLSSLVPLHEADGEPRGRRPARVESVRQALRTARDAPDLANIRETRWGALQAITSHATHARPARRSRTVSEADATFERVSERAVLTDRAHALLTT